MMWMQIAAIAALPVMWFCIDLWRDIAARSKNPIDPWGMA